MVSAVGASRILKATNENFVPLDTVSYRAFMVKYSTVRNAGVTVSLLMTDSP